MHLSLIQEGEELEKRATKGWKETRLESGNSAIYVYLEGRGVEEYSLTAGINGHEIPTNDARLIVYMRTHAKDLLEAAKEVEVLKKELASVRLKERMNLIDALKKKLAKEPETLEFITELLNVL